MQLTFGGILIKNDNTLSKLLKNIFDVVFILAILAGAGVGMGVSFPVIAITGKDTPIPTPAPARIARIKTTSNIFFNSLLKVLSFLINMPPKVSCTLGFFKIAIVKATPGRA